MCLSRENEPKGVGGKQLSENQGGLCKAGKDSGIFSLQEECGRHTGDLHEMLSKYLWDMSGRPGPRLFAHGVAEETLSL